MKKFLFLLFSFVFSFLPFLVSNQVSASVTQQEDGSYLVTTGNDIYTLISSATSGQSLTIVANNDLTIGTQNPQLPTNLTLTLDMNGHALFNSGSNFYRMNTGDHVTFQNEVNVATQTTSSLSGPSPSGTPNTTVYRNGYYAIFMNQTNSMTGSSLTYKNVTEDFHTITTWAGGTGQPFYNYGLQVQFSGNNYFNYPTTNEEGMEGSGFKVLDGKTQLIGSFSKNFVTAYWYSNAGPSGIDVAAGAEFDLNINVQGGAAPWPVYNTTDFHINNGGTLAWTMTGTYANNNFYGGTTLSNPVNYNFTQNSTTTLNVPGLFNYGLTSGAHTTNILGNADFTYTTTSTAPIFIGTLTSSDAFNIHSANRVRINTPAASSSSILGTDASAMLINLALDASDTTAIGYGINAYDNGGVSTLTSSPTTGAYAVLGTFHSNLADLNHLTGTRPPTSSDITIYQNAAQLEFVKQTGSLSFTSVPDDSAMTFNYTLGPIPPEGSLLSRTGTNSNMAFGIIDTYPNPAFSVQASLMDSSLPSGMSFVWQNAGASTLTALGASPAMIFNSATSGISGSNGNYQVSFPASQGLLLQVNDGKYYSGDYNAQLQWTLVNGI